MSKMFNIENCDVTMENGCLRLIYHTDELLMPMTLAISKTYHDLNEKGMYLFGQEDWVGNVVEWSIRKESPIWHNLLADIYKNHHDLYSSIMVTPEDDEYDNDVDDNDKVLGYLTLEATGDIDEKTGHRIAHFNTADLAALDNGILHVLAEACGIKDGEYRLITLPGFLYANYFTAYLGFYPFGFFSTDYFPLTPWLFLFWAGFYLHHLAERTAQSLRPLRRSVCPPLGWLGRNSLMLYLLHQPVIYGVLTMVFLLLRRGGGAL